MNHFSKIATLLFLAACTAGAATIQFTGEPTGVNDGSFYVLPYQITIDGAAQIVTCYDFVDDVQVGDRWQANILTLSEAAATGFFGAAGTSAAYDRVAWLSAQTYTGADQQVGLQHAIWNIFASVPQTPATRAYEAAADAAAASGYAGFDFSGFRFIQQPAAVAGHSGTEQAFVYRQSALGFSTASPVPEPGTMPLFFAGIALVFIGSRRFRQAKRG